MEHSDLLGEIELIRRALALKHRIGALYSYHDVYYLTPVEIDTSDSFGSSRRRNSRRRMRCGPDREARREKTVEIAGNGLRLNQIVVRMILRRNSACIPQRGRLNARFALSLSHKVVCREPMS